MELKNATTPHALNELFRERTPAVILVSALLELAESKFPHFRSHLVEFALSHIKVNQQHEVILSTVFLNKLLSEFVCQLERIKGSDIPDELILVLRILLKTLLEMNVDRKRIPGLLGSMFFLRFVVPALAQPENFVKQFVKQDAPSKECLKNLVRNLQHISNQTEPSESEFSYPIRAEMESLHLRVEQFLLRISMVPVPSTEERGSLIVPAAKIFRVLTQIDRDVLCHGTRLAIEKLIERLGTVPNIDIKKDDDVPLITQIRAIEQYLKSANN